MDSYAHKCLYSRAGKAPRTIMNSASSMVDARVRAPTWLLSRAIISNTGRRECIFSQHCGLGCAKIVIFPGFNNILGLPS